MKATPFSKEQYYPMSLASGRDAVIINHTGSGFLSESGHTHGEGHHGLVSGWYKSAHREASPKPYSPVLCAGVQIYSGGVSAEPIFYEQEFVPEDGTLYTELKFRFGLRLRITSFITYSDSVWCERIEVLETDKKREYRLGFRVRKPELPTPLPKGDHLSFRSDNDRLYLDYNSFGFTGRGLFLMDRPFDEAVIKDGFAEVKYSMPLSVGDVYFRTAFLLADSEKHRTYDELTEIAERGFDRLYAENKALWNSYIRTSSVEIEDEKLTYIYNFSRYILKSNQHPDTGMIALGMQPVHWGGGISCSWDANFSHEAFLVTGSESEARLFTEQFIKQADIGYETMKRCGYPGVGFTGWTTLSGGFAGARSIDEWITNFKPMFSAYAIYSIYNQWKTDSDFDSDRYRKIAEDVLVFWLHRMIKQGEDELYYLTSVKDGSECDLDAEVDTFTQIIFAKAFVYYGEVYGDEKYREIGRRMLRALECNRLPEGGFSLFRGSEQAAGLLIHYPIVYPDRLISDENMLSEIEEMKTPFGLENTLMVEEYRHWSWNDSFALRALIRMKRGSEAKERVAHMSYGASALGALPEKIRLDGFPIRYYYTSPHALLVCALAESFAVKGHGTELLLGYGLGGSLANAFCEGIRTEGGLSVSLRIKDGRLLSLSLENLTDREITLTPSLNPDVRADGLPERITLSGKGRFAFGE